MGTTGEYSDRQEWPVMAYRESRLAKIHVHNATRAAKLMEPFRPIIDPGKKNPYDPHMQMQMSYRGTSYFIMEVELDE